MEPATKFEPLPVPAMKFVPAIVSIVSPDPAVIVLGFSEVIAGPFTLNALAVEDDVLVFFTVTFADPAEAS